MAMGPKEAALKAQREARAKGGDLQTMDRAERAAVQKTRTAAPSPKAAAGGSGPPKRPPVVVAAAEPEKSKGVDLLIRGLPDWVPARLEVERAKLGFRSRNETAAYFLLKGLPK